MENHSENLTKPEKQIKNLNDAEDLLFKILENTGNLIDMFQQASEIKPQTHRKDSLYIPDNNMNGTMEIEEVKENGIEETDISAISSQGVNIYKDLLKFKKNMLAVIDGLEAAYPKQSKINSLALLEGDAIKDSMNSLLSGFTMSVNDEQRNFEK